MEQDAGALRAATTLINSRQEMLARGIMLDGGEEKGGNKVVVLGGGPAGLSCAVQLKKYGIRIAVIEKELQAGGLAKTLHLGQFRTDLGPHRFYPDSNGPELSKIVGRAGAQSLRKVGRKAGVSVGGKIADAPVDWDASLSGVGFPLEWDFFRSMLPTSVFRGLLSDLVSPQEQRNDYSLEDAINKKLDGPSADAVRQFVQKMWGLPCDEVSVDWMPPQWLSKKKADAKAGKDETFAYPEYGFGQLAETMSASLKEAVGLGRKAAKVRHENGRIISVETDGGEKIPADYLVCTIPLGELVNALDPRPPQEILLAAANLRYRAVVFLLLMLSKPSASKYQWITFPQKDAPFIRVTEMKNFSQYMAPREKTALLLEFMCWPDDETWRMDKEELLDRSVTALERAGLFRRGELLQAVRFAERDSYPVFDTEYADNLFKIERYLDGFENLTRAGRQGKFSYINAYEAITAGANAADIIAHRMEKGAQKKA